MGSASVTVITPQEVLESLMNDGTIDAIRLKIINHLKANEELKNSTITMVEQSKVLNSPGAEKHTKRELFDALRQEIEVPALEKASKAVWELILDNDGIGKEINGTVERVFCRLSGREPPLFPPLITELENDKVEENESLGKENGDEIEGEEKETENLGKEKEDGDFGTSVKKKRKRSVRVEERDVVVGSGDSPSVRDDSVSVPRTRTVSAGCGKSVESDTRCKRTDGKTWRCTKDCLPDSKYCDKHIYRGKTPKKQVESANKATSSNRKKQVESTNKATSSNNMIDSSPDIPSSSPS